MLLLCTFIMGCNRPVDKYALLQHVKLKSNLGYSVLSTKPYLHFVRKRTCNETIKSEVLVKYSYWCDRKI